jgi:pimeloyl-ACP methyl ester carboxylesterase
VIIALLLFAAFFVFPLLKEAAKQKLGEKERTNAPGNFVTLSRGVVHYRWFGAETGDLIVCIHGLTTPSFVFEGLASHYANIGKRVLVYDHYGRGYSDRPKAKQDKLFFINQLDELLNKLEIKKQKFELVGYSMGGSIAAAYAAHNPDRLNKLILIASAGAGHNLGFSAKVAKIPLFGWALFSIFFGLQHAHSTEKDRDIKSSVPKVVERQLNELLYKGFVPSVLASIKGVLSNDNYEDHQALRSANFEILALWGDCDTVIPISSKEIFSSWNSRIKNIVIRNGSHALPFTHAREIIDVTNLST